MGVRAETELGDHLRFPTFIIFLLKNHCGSVTSKMVVWFLNYCHVIGDKTHMSILILGPTQQSQGILNGEGVLGVVN